MRGRKPKPSHLRVIGGNAGHRPLNKREPKPSRKLPTPPRELNKDAKREWRLVAPELYRNGLLTALDRAALAAYCESYGTWVQALRIKAEMAVRNPATAGLIMTTKNGNAIQSPLLGIANKAAADMARYAEQFGMTPSARSRINAETPQVEDAADKYFAR